MMKRFLAVILVFFPLFTLQSEIKAVVFDFGNVLMRFKEGKSPTLQFMSETLGCSYGAVLTEIKNDYFESLVSGHQDEEEYWQEFAAHLNVPYPEKWVTKWQNFHMSAIEMNHELFEVIVELKKKGYQVGLLSNQVASLSEVYQREGYYDLFDPLILSYEVKVSKPDAGIYHVLLSEIVLQPDEILFIDDKEENLKVARELGIQTIHYDYNKYSIEAFLKHLQEHQIRL